MIKEFPNRGWNKIKLNRLIRKIDETRTSSRKPRESLRTALTPANVARVSELICSQAMTRIQQISTGNSARNRDFQKHVRRFAKYDLKLKIFRRRQVQQLSDSDAKKRLKACKRLKLLQTLASFQPFLCDDC